MKDLILTIENGIALVTLNRPEALNALSGNMAMELSSVFSELENDRSVNIIIVTGAGEKAFCSGVDLKERLGLSPKETTELRRYGLKLFLRDMEEMTKPIIAAINGIAFGGGVELALVCDIRIASENATFGLREVKWGIIPAAGACIRLPYVIGMGKAKELIFTGRTIGAEEALRIGLVNKVVPFKELLNASYEIAREINENAPIAVRQAKRAINMGANLKLALEFNLEASKECYNTQDRLEGISAFNEKRKPVYKGE